MHLQVENIGKNYKSGPVLNGISFRVDGGKIFGLLGPNGAGKTTLIRIILNILSPTEGKVKVDVNGSPVSSEFFGYLPEERGLYKKSKVSDVLKFFGRLRGLKDAEASERTGEWLSRFGISSYSNRRIEELSKGNQQKIQFISAILHDPKILILDEPYSGFDPVNQDEITSVIKEFREKDRIIILSTHLLDKAEEICDQIFLIHSGRKILSGDLQKIKEDFSEQRFILKTDKDISVFSDQLEFEVLERNENSFTITIPADKRKNFLRNASQYLEISEFKPIDQRLNSIFLEAVRSN